MKTKTLSLSAFIAALAAAALLPIRPELACSLVFGTGLFAILAADYAVTDRMRRSYAAATAAPVARAGSNLRLAA
jgi:type IV secretory pathway TrbL component